VRSSVIKYPIDVYPFVSKYADCRQENFLVITLSGVHEVINVHHISKGLVNKTITHPRECFFPAIVDNAVAVIFAHNHPSGHVGVSSDDMDVTKCLCMAGKILGFHIVDHIVFADSGKFCSLRQEGVLPEEFTQSELDKYVVKLSSSKQGNRGKKKKVTGEPWLSFLPA